jgi:hypothetical protein
MPEGSKSCTARREGGVTYSFALQRSHHPLVKFRCDNGMAISYDFRLRRSIEDRLAKTSSTGGSCGGRNDHNSTVASANFGWRD